MKIAEDINGFGISIGGDEFKSSVRKIVKEKRPKIILETGTFLGEGSTKILLDALEELGEEYKMYSIEINPDYFEKAVNNLQGYNICLLNGLSIPRSLLPSQEQIRNYIKQFSDKDIWVDHQDLDREKLYYSECNFDGMDDCIGYCMELVDYKPDLVLLDSAGHLGFIEFEYVLSLIRKSCIIILDDVFHIKHYQSLQKILEDKNRFNILKLSTEKFGFVIAEVRYK